MTGACAVLVVACVLALPRRATAAARLALPLRPHERRALRPPVLLLLAAVASTSAIALGVAVPVAGAVAVLAVLRRVRSRPPVASDVALSLDLLAACLDAGATLPAALEAAGSVADDTAAAALRSTASSLLRGGADDAWAACLGDPRLATAARTCRRARSTGAAAAEDLRRLAARDRAAQRSARQHRAQRAAVWVVLPLGLCFLPAFVLIAVVPLVATLLPRLG